MVMTLTCAYSLGLVTASSAPPLPQKLPLAQHGRTGSACYVRFTECSTMERQQKLQDEERREMGNLQNNAHMLSSTAPETAAPLGE